MYPLVSTYDWLACNFQDHLWKLFWRWRLHWEYSSLQEWRQILVLDCIYIYIYIYCQEINKLTFDFFQNSWMYSASLPFHYHPLCIPGLFSATGVFEKWFIVGFYVFGSMFPIVLFCQPDHWLAFHLPSLCFILFTSLELSFHSLKESFFFAFYCLLFVNHAGLFLYICEAFPNCTVYVLTEFPGLYF